MIKKNRLTSAITLGIFSLSAQCLAADIEVSAAIESATVFRHGAEVTRAAQVNIPAGEHRLIFTGLPANIDPARLQLGVGNSAIRLADIQLEEFHAGQLTSMEEQTLQQELDDLLFEKIAISDEILSAQTQLQLLESLASGALGGTETSLNGNELTELLGSLSTNSATARALIRDANKRIRSVDQAVEQKRFELAQIATNRKSQNVLTVAVQVDSASQTGVEFTYPVQQANWQWIYESRLNTETKRLDIKRKVAVSQSSGEDWNNVRLNISTALPHQETQTPELDSLLVDLYRPQPIRMAQSRATANQGFLESDMKMEELSLAADYANYSSYANVDASQYKMDFDVPGTIDISANGQKRILPIDDRSQSVDLVVRTVPDVSLNAFLEARFSFDSDLPMEAGEMQFYRDGTFIGSDFIDRFMPHEEVSLAFGQDDRVQVELRHDEEESREGSTFRRNTVEDHRSRYLITNFHPQEMQVEVLSRLPVPQNESIDVVINREATAISQTDVEGKTGVVMWTLNAAPSETEEIKHYYEVRFPRDQAINYR